MLTYMRPAGSDTEHAFITRYVKGLPGAVEDPYHNWHVVVGDSPILWSCHTDTVHHSEGFQTLHVEKGIAGLSKRSKQFSNCLGADDTAGVYLCREMILRGIPGHYVFHHAEERGGIGSSDLAYNPGAWLDGVQFAIALDRKGTGDVITHQCRRCCSDAFADSLALELNKGGLHYRADDTGLFTDTANYTNLIDECTNLSIGYAHCHSSKETLDLGFVGELLEALCRVDPANIINSRKPGEWDSDYIRYTQWTTANRTVLDFTQATEQPEQPYRSSVFCEVCEYCGSQFAPDESSALRFTVYCDRDCEHLNEGLQTVTPYLDPAYGDVLATLKRRTH